MFSAASVCLSVCVVVCLFVCQHDNFRTSKHRMMKLGGRFPFWSRVIGVQISHFGRCVWSHSKNCKN